MSEKETARSQDNLEIEVDEMNVILKIPKNSVRIKLEAVLLPDDGDKLITVYKRLNLEEIRKARQDFLDNVEGGDDYDAVYVLTDKGREYLDGLKASCDYLDELIPGDDE